MTQTYKEVYEAYVATEKADEANKPPPTAEEELRALRTEVEGLRQIALQHLELTKPKLERKTMTQKAKLAYIRENGIDKYKQLPWD